MATLGSGRVKLCGLTHQPSFALAEFAAKEKITRHEKFLARMEEVIPWAPLLAVIEPFYPQVQRGRPPLGLERMRRVYFLQQWYALAAAALEDALYDSHALQSVARIDLAAEGVPDATTLLNFRRLLETHDLCKNPFTAINADLSARGLLLRAGTLVNATLIAVPSSTKNKEKKRDPEMHRTKKGHQWYFGRKAHIGADRASKPTDKPAASRAFSDPPGANRLRRKWKIQNLALFSASLNGANWGRLMPALLPFH